MSSYLSILNFSIVLYLNEIFLIPVHGQIPHLQTKALLGYTCGSIIFYSDCPSSFMLGWVIKKYMIYSRFIEYNPLRAFSLAFKVHSLCRCLILRALNFLLVAVGLRWSVSGYTTVLVYFWTYYYPVYILLICIVQSCRSS